MPSPIGRLLREWRAARRMSQLDLALEAEVSARHLSCIETGKSKASKDVIGRLADALGMPLRERNVLIRAGGFATEFSETPLITPTLDRMRDAIALILRHQEPYPAFVVSRHWEVLHANDAAMRINHFLMQGRPLRHTNLLHQVFDPEDFRPVIVNWQEVAGRFIRHLHDVVTSVPTDDHSRRLLEELLVYPDVPSHWRSMDASEGITPVLNLVFRSSVGELRFFETMTTFIDPRDVTLEELRIECCFPADEKTAAFCQHLRETSQAAA
ncbi:helix-turn-helix transcriptional regulator [Dyella sp. 2HG41-7]|uniref:helix-turn-helix domain-containing protein n=1 Tax=Dyella sp. 2HG41-7 TaxID=2883239 RepID=UPI001F244E1B|nr:helix-turn-helix transcriptional regulator [Dyella sp. 2HG41-7]